MSAERRTHARRTLRAGTIGPGDRRTPTDRRAMERRVLNTPQRRPRSTDMKTGQRLYTERRAP